MEEEKEVEQPISSRLSEIKGKHGYKWKYPSARKKRTSFMPGPKVKPRNIKCSVEAWSHSLDKEIIDAILIHINKKRTQM